jgi:hypothetical protein
MLDFAVQYEEALKEFTAQSDNDLRGYRLTETEWNLVKELCETLFVSSKSASQLHLPLTTAFHRPVSERCYFILLPAFTESS